MIAYIKNGRLDYIEIYRKCYKKARWKRAINRLIKRTLEYKPDYNGIIVTL